MSPAKAGDVNSAIAAATSIVRRFMAAILLRRYPSCTRDWLAPHLRRPRGGRPAIFCRVLPDRQAIARHVHVEQSLGVAGEVARLGDVEDVQPVLGAGGG